MRFNIFLPFLRKTKRGQEPRQPSRLAQLARRALPTKFFSDRATGKPGLIRRGLKRIGVSCLSSPVRRVIQAACFVGFLVLFFFVCWPYTAKPARSWDNWVAATSDAALGQVTLLTATAPESVPKVGTLLHLSDRSLPATDDPAAGYAGVFRVEQAAAKEILLIATVPLPEEGLEPGPWRLSEVHPASWPAHYATDLQRKEQVSAELFLSIDPLLSLSTAVASRSWIWSLSSAGIILLVCVFVPRGFCGYLCPLGTLIDLFDGVIGKRITRFRVSADGWWVHLKYYILLGTMIAACGGVLVSGFVAAIPVITRGLLFTISPLQTGALRGWHLMPPLNAGHWFSIVLFVGVLGLGLLRPRFWCKYVCPSGAVFSLGNLFRVTERKVESSCINCNKCIEVCPFDAIKLDFTTRTTDCTLCQTCGGVCPTEAIKFVDRWELIDLKMFNDPPTHETSLGRRGFLAAGVGLASAVVGGISTAAVTRATSPNLDDPTVWRPVRPPGSVPEPLFWEMCIRCGECFKACPNDVLHSLGFQQGLAGLWTPHVVADWAGCESSCNACGQVCPTGAIRALPLAEKQVCRIGLAELNLTTCLPHAGREACQLCVDECHHAGYHAIEFTRVGTEVDAAGNPIDDSGFLAPVVLADKCVGCGLCQTRCYGINVLDRHVLDSSAIVITAKPGFEDRLTSGSYLALQAAEAGHESSKAKT